MTNPNANSPSYKSYKLLHRTFIVLPIVAGVDKFFDLLANWTIYLSPHISRFIEPAIFMKVVGVVEIAAGVLTIINPRLGGLIISCWLGAIIINLLSIPGYFDIALRDAGLAMAALTLSCLSKEHVVALKA